MNGKVARVLLASGLIFLAGCSPEHILKSENALTTVVLQDRNGFSETVSQSDRLSRLEGVDFLSPQPYERVIRVFQRRDDGSVPSVLSCYYPNGQISELLDVVSGRAYGRYSRWHPNGQKQLEAIVMGGIADVTDRAKQTWLFDGESQVWDSEGRRIAFIPYEKGALHGQEEHYFPSGAMKERRPHFKGQLHGVCELFTESGELLQRQEYEFGQPHGKSEAWWLREHRLSANELWSRGALLQGEYFLPDGTLVGQVQQGSGERVLFENGRVHRRYQVQAGQVDGLIEEFSPSGLLTRSWCETQGLRQGLERVYDAKNGRLKLELSWKDDILQGPCRSYYPDGRLESQRECSDNQIEGRCVAWYPSGQLMLLEDYQQGLLDRGEYYELGSLVPVSQVVQRHGTVTLYDASGRKTRSVPIVNGVPAP